jgi:hypothetical protein
MLFEIPFAGDPTLLGWTTFALYLIAVVLSFRAAKVSRSRNQAVVGQVWSWIALGLLVLGLNKQLDLQTWIIHFAGRIAKRENVYEYRRTLHALFFLGLITLSVVIALRWSANLRVFARQVPMAASGCALVTAYLVVRAASIDQVDRLLGFDLERTPGLWLLEVGGLGMVIVGGQLKRQNEK